MLALFRRYFIAGLIIWLPILVVVFIIGFFIGVTDALIGMLPEQYQPSSLLGWTAPGIGIIIAVVIIFITGALTTNYFGNKLVAFWDALVERIPLVRSIYKATKQVSHTLLSSENESFRKVLLFEYPRKDTWSVGFWVSDTCDAIAKYHEQEMINIFVPTTPNPTSGYLLVLPKADVIELDMSIDDALKFIISLGVMQPSS